MSRWSSSPKESPKKTELDPIWRGVGFFVLVALTVGGFWGAGVIIDLNRQHAFLPFPVPEGYSMHIVGPIYLGARLLVQLGFMLVVDLVGYALMTIVYGMVNPIRPGEKDAPPLHRSGPRKPSR